jgi:hypothetical protein
MVYPTLPRGHEHFLLVWLAAMMFLNIGCSNRPSRKPLAVFAGFAYVGEAPFSQAEISEMRAPLHGQVEMPMPKQLSADKQYIFHHHRPLDGWRLYGICVQ